MLRYICFQLTLLPTFSFLLRSQNVSGTELYDLTHPQKVYDLPSELREISGFTFLKKGLLACVQDEVGAIFILDEEKSFITRRIPFAPNGDFEGVTLADETLYALRSDGTIFQIMNWRKNEAVQTHSFTTGIPAMNNEGLCYDAANKRLLVGCKSKPGKGPHFKDQREIYAFDLKTMRTGTAPIYTFSIQQLVAYAGAHQISLPVKIKGKTAQPFLKLGTSEIAIHPHTGHLYLLSAADHMLFIFSAGGEVLKMQPLDQQMFNKPEGIDFSENGDLYISNEGQDHEATLLKFTMRKIR